MDKTQVTVTAIDELFRTRQTLWAIQKLLYGLEDFVEVRGVDEASDAALKEMSAKHDLHVEWMTPLPLRTKKARQESPAGQVSDVRENASGLMEVARDLWTALRG